MNKKQKDRMEYVVKILCLDLGNVSIHNMIKEAYKKGFKDGEKIIKEVKK